jgi:site-specific recombinase XerD
MLYTSGFGAAEVISLKVGDIGSKRMLIRVEAATFQCCTSAAPTLDQQ